MSTLTHIGFLGLGHMGAAIAARLAPAVPVRDPVRHRTAPWAALVDCSVAAAIIGWRPAYSWAGRRQSGEHGMVGSKP